MYLQSWQIFALGCIVGIVISYILLCIMASRSNIQPRIVQAPSKSDKAVDLIAKLNYILLLKNVLTPEDTQFMLDNLTYEDWKKSFSTENNESKEAKDENN